MYVHESIQVGLSSGNLTCVEDEDTKVITEAVKKQLIVAAPGHIHTSVEITLALIHLAVSKPLQNTVLILGLHTQLACRTIYRVLTSHKLGIMN